MIEKTPKIIQSIIFNDIEFTTRKENFYWAVSGNFFISDIVSLEDAHKIKDSFDKWLVANGIGITSSNSTLNRHKLEKKGDVKETKN